MKVRSTAAFLLAVLAWSGCATGPRPLVDSGFAARAYTPGRIAVLPPDVFVVLDQVGDDDPVQSAAVGQQVAAQTTGAITQALRARGYDVDPLSRWDGVYGPNGAPLAGGDALAELARGIVAFSSSPDGGRQGSTGAPPRIAPEVAAQVGAATQSDAVLYVNLKGVVTTPGRQAATILTAVFIVVVVAALILVLASQKGGGGPHGWAGNSGARAASGHGAWRAAPPVAGALRPTAVLHPGAGPAVAVARRPAPPVGWRGAGGPPVVMRGGPVYWGGFANLGLVVPLDGPLCTHDGSIAYDDPIFAGDELYVSMTLVSTYDGRVLWHARDALDLEANRPGDVDRMVQSFLATLPPALPPPPPASPSPAPPAP